MTTDFSEFLLCIWISSLYLESHNWQPWFFTFTHIFFSTFPVFQLTAILPQKHTSQVAWFIFTTAKTHSCRILFGIAFHLGDQDSRFSGEILPGPYLSDSVQLPKLLRILLEMWIILKCLRSSKYPSLNTFTAWDCLGIGAWARSMFKFGKLGCTGSSLLDVSLFWFPHFL